MHMRGMSCLAVLLASISLLACATTPERMETAEDGLRPPRPRVRIPPTYPSRALRDGVEGYIQVGLTVSGRGRVVDVEVLAADPPGVFDRDVERLVGKWEYEETWIDGEFITRAPVIVTFQFDIAPCSPKRGLDGELLHVCTKRAR